MQQMSVASSAWPNLFQWSCSEQFHWLPVSHPRMYQSISLIFFLSVFPDAWQVYFTRCRRNSASHYVFKGIEIKHIIFEVLNIYTHTHICWNVDRQLDNVWNSRGWSELKTYIWQLSENISNHKSEWSPKGINIGSKDQSTRTELWGTPTIRNIPFFASK